MIKGKRYFLSIVTILLSYAFNAEKYIDNDVNR